ncbi:ureidoglycolate lyase [Nitrincola tapanii]
MQLPITPLTQENFAPFGDLIDWRQAEHFLINAGTTQRFHCLAEVNTGAEDGRAIISIFRKPQADSLPLRVTLLERHPQGSQAFIPLNAQPFFILVAPATEGSKPDLHQLKLFLSDGQQGVNYAAGVWHHPLIALQDGDCFLVVDRQGDLANCDEYTLEAHLELWIPALSASTDTLCVHDSNA